MAKTPDNEENVTFVEKQFHEKKYENSQGIAYIWRTAEKGIFKRVLAKSNGKTILEIGCGDGTTMSYFASKLCISDSNYIGTDISVNAIRQSKKILPGGEFFVSNCTELPVNSNSVDIVLCLGVLHHLEYPYDGLKEIFRVLKKNGILLLREPTDEAFKIGGGESPFEAGLNVKELESVIGKKGGKIMVTMKMNPKITHPIRYFLERLNEPFLWENKLKIDKLIYKINRDRVKSFRGIDLLMIVRKFDI